MKYKIIKTTGYMMKKLSKHKLDKFTLRFINDYFIYVPNMFTFTSELHKTFKYALSMNSLHSESIELVTDAWIEQDTINLFSRLFFDRNPVLIENYYKLGYYHISLKTAKDKINHDKHAILRHFIDKTIKYKHNSKLSVIEICDAYIYWWKKTISNRMPWSRSTLQNKIKAILIDDLINLNDSVMIPYSHKFTIYDTLNEQKSLYQIRQKNLKPLIVSDTMTVSEIQKLLSSDIQNVLIMDIPYIERASSMKINRIMFNFIIEDIVYSIMGDDYYKIRTELILDRNFLLGSGLSQTYQFEKIKHTNAHWKKKIKKYVHVTEDDNYECVYEQCVKLDKILRYILSLSTAVYVKPVFKGSFIRSFAHLLVDDIAYIILQKNTLANNEKYYGLRIQVLYCLIKSSYNNFKKIGLVFIESQEIVIIDLSKWKLHNEFLGIIKHCINRGINDVMDISKVAPINIENNVEEYDDLTVIYLIMT